MTVQSPSRRGAGVVRRFDDVGFGFQSVEHDFPAAIDVVPQGDAVDAGVEQLACRFSGVMPDPSAAFSALATTRSSRLAR